jgi:membrane protease YdiL (CAAX protease family)
MIAASYSAIAQVASTESALPPVYVWLLAGTVLTIIQCSAEEMLLRGWLQPVLAEHWHSWVAVIAAALVFAALHLLGGARSPLTLVNLLLAGIFFGLLALRTGGIAAPIAAHFAWNWSEALLLGLDVNPGVGSYGALFNLELSGSSWWGGSQEGLNSSIGVTFVLVALVIGCAGPFGQGRARSS